MKIVIIRNSFRDEKSCIKIYRWVNDFESFITLEQDPNDDGDWVLRQGSTPSYNTGPSGDHTTGSGVYYYVAVVLSSASGVESIPVVSSVY